MLSSRDKARPLAPPFEYQSMSLQAWYWHLILLPSNRPWLFCLFCSWHHKSNDNVKHNIVMTISFPSRFFTVQMYTLVPPQPLKEVYMKLSIFYYLHLLLYVKVLIHDKTIMWQNSTMAFFIVIAKVWLTISTSVSKIHVLVLERLKKTQRMQYDFRMTLLTITWLLYVDVPSESIVFSKL